MPAPNITNPFISFLIANARSIEGSWPHWYSGLWGLIGGNEGLIDHVADPMLYFRNKVRAGGDWDFKSNWLKTYKDTGVEIAGRTYLYDMPGNFHYGYVGAAAGVSDSMLFSQAGKAQVSAGTSKPEYWCTDGDDPMDHEFIRLGIKLWDDSEYAVSETTLHSLLGQYKPEVCGPEDD